MTAQRISDVRQVTRQLAGDWRILGWVQGLPSRVDQLVAAVLDRDWREVDRLSEQLAAARREGCERLQEQAAALRRELAKPDNEQAVKQVLVRLIFECGRVDPRDLEPRQPLRAAAQDTADAARG